MREEATSAETQSSSNANQTFREMNTLRSSRLLSSLLLVSSAVFLVAVTAGCGKGQGETTLDARFLEHPDGGQYISRVEAEFNLNRSFTDQSGLFQTPPKPEDLTVTVEWVYANYDGTNPTVAYSDEVVVDEESENRLYYYEAPEGKVLVGNWYLRLTWRDDDGRQTATSTAAVCTNPSTTNGSPPVAGVVDAPVPSSSKLAD